MKLKKVLALTLAIAMVLSTMGTVVFADGSFSLGNEYIAYTSGTFGEADYREGLVINIDGLPEVINSSMVVELYNNEDLISTTSLREAKIPMTTAELSDGTRRLTVNKVLYGEESSSWGTTWAKLPTNGNFPNKMVVAVDGITETLAFDLLNESDWAVFKKLFSVAAAKIGDDYYYTLQDAVDAATAGDTITIIDNISELADIVNAGNSLKGITIKLGTDFDLAGVEWTPIGNSTNKFEGYFDGENHTISNLTVTGNNNHAGFFGYIKGDSMTATATPTVQNLNFVNASVEGDYYVGGLSGQGYTCAVKNVTYSGKVNGTRYVGGLIGHVYTYLENCHFKGDVTASFDAGGGIAGAGDGRVYNSSVIGTVSGNNWMGGIIGNGQEGTSAVGCYVKATVSSGTNYYYGIGGIAGVAGHGYASSEFKNNYFDGEVYLCGEKVDAIVLGIVNADNNEAIKTTVSGNSWNTEFYPADTLVFVTAEATKSPTADEWKAAAAEEFTQSRNNNLVMLESDLEYVDAINPEDVTIMSFSGVTEEAVEETTQANIIAKIGDVPYATLQDAFDAAQNGDKVTILKDMTIDSETYTIADGTSITLDMNGKKFTVTDNKTSNYELFYIYGGLTVIGDGAIELTATNDRDWNAMSAIFHNRGGVLNIESGTYTNKGGTDMAYVVDNSGNYYGDATTTISGTTVLDSSYIAIRNRMEQNSHGASGKAILNVTGGTISAVKRAIWAQAASTNVAYPATGEINISGGTINGLIDTPRSEGAMSLTTISGGTVQDIQTEAGELKITGGSINGTLTILDAAGNAVESDAIISGGTFSSNVSAYLAEGIELQRTGAGVYTAINTNDGNTEDDELDSLTADTISIVYKDITGDAEGKKVYQIIAKANGDDKINEFASAELTFANASKLLNGKDMPYVIESADNMTLSTKQGKPDYYGFSMEGDDEYEIVGNEVLLGTVTFEGYGNISFATVDGMVNATTVSDNLVDTYTIKGATDSDATTGGLIINTDIEGTDLVGKIEGEDAVIAVPVRDLTINIDFPNAVANQSKAYQEMKVVISGGDLKENIEIKLGEDWAATGLEIAGKVDADCTVTYANNAYAINVIKALTLNNAYTVTVSGAGYRTARYTVTMTKDKTLNFWNNVMDDPTVVEEGELSETKNFLAGDIVKDNNINIYDLSAVVSYFGTQTIDAEENIFEADYAKYDLNRDGIIDSRDVAYVLVSWGE